MNRFTIDFQPLSRDYGDAVARVTYAEVSIVADGLTATNLEDIRAKTVRRGVRVSIFTLAQWFAFNWWRLRWEPERDTLSWRMSHKIGGVGGGYLWPDLTFIGDGGTVLVHAKSSPPGTDQVVRYLNDFDISVPADDFERGIDTFIDAVIGRLAGTGVNSDELTEIWKEVWEERRTPKLAAWRKLEAVLGFDAGEAPDRLITELQEAEATYGMGAVEEMAAESMGNALADIKALWDGPRRAASSLQIPHFDTLRRRIREEVQPSLFPWQKATEAARIAREVWSLEAGPISTPTLSKIFNVSPAAICEPTGVEGPMNAGFRNGSSDGFNVFLKSPYPTNRRFALLRLVGDHLAAPREDRLLPAAQRAGTQRQKFQRAFSQEVLCPYSDLLAVIGSTEPTDDAMEDAARTFDVSPLMIKTILVNKGAASGDTFAELRRCR